MKKTTGNKKGTLPVLMMILAFGLLAEIPMDEVRNVFRFLSRYGFDPHRIQFLFQAAPKSAAVTLVFVLLCIIILISFLRLIRNIFSSAGQDKIPKEVKEAKKQMPSYVYKGGNERYMAQLDDFLRDGLITREEYLELKQKLLK